MSFTIKKAPKEHYVLDNIGNRNIVTNPTDTIVYGVNSLNQYTNIVDGVTNSPTYDLDGNMLSNGDWTYTWNGENRLVGASNATQVLSFAYDYLGRRFSKVVGGDETTFLYDGWNMVRESSSTETNHYVWGLDLSQSIQGAGGVGGLLSVTEDEGSVYSPVIDANGNVTGYIDDSGNVKAVYTYNAFGGIIASSGSKADDFKFGFSTKCQDETGLNYYGYRYYDAGLGRWLNRDPIGENGGLNLYGAGANNYINYYDYRGLCAAAILEVLTVEGPIILSESVVIIEGLFVLVTSYTIVISVKTIWQDYKDECSKCVKDGVSDTKELIRRTWEKFSKGGRGKGERGHTSKPDKPWKHARPKKGGGYEVKDPVTGKWKTKPPKWTP